MTAKTKTNIIIQLSLLGVLILTILGNFLFGNLMSEMILINYSNFLYALIISIIAVLCYCVPISGIIFDILFVGLTIFNSYFQYSIGSKPIIDQIEFIITPLSILLFALIPVFKKVLHKPIISYYLVFVIYLTVQIILNFKNYDNAITSIFNLFNLYSLLIAILLPIVLFFSEKWYNIKPAKEKD
ncbi:MAG: hypothetical protein RR306_02170 [Clostridia bacterium]